MVASVGDGTGDGAFFLVKVGDLANLGRVKVKSYGSNKPNLSATTLGKRILMEPEEIKRMTEYMEHR